METKMIKANPTREFFVNMLVRDILLKQAIIELIDNSIDGARTIKKDNDFTGLKIAVDFDGDSFCIRDNCGGIPLDVAQEYAFRFGRPKEKETGKEMISSGTVDAIRNEAGNIRYDYFFPLGDEETVLLIDSWENQESIDFHHQSPMMNKIAELRDKYNLHMKVERYRSEDTIPDTDQKYIRN